MTLRNIGVWTLCAALLLCAMPRAEQRAAAALKGLKVEDSASPELVGHLVKGLSITPGQAEGAAGAMLGLAKSRLSPADFGEVSKAIPGIDNLLKMAPALAGAGSQLGGLMSLAGTFKQLGLDPSMVAKAVPLLTSFLSGKGATGAAKLLGGVLK